MGDFKHQINTLRFSRKALVNLIGKYSAEQINAIPTGFKNNLIWNLAHCVCSTTSLCYGPSGNKPQVEAKYIERYKMGTKPEGDVNEDEIKFWRELALSSLDQMEEDFDNGKFENYHAFDITPNYKISTIHDALDFASFHEGSHFGYALALKNSL